MSDGDGVKKTVVLPISGQRNILITSALPYVNNVPHLGNIIGCVLSADVFARFCRGRGLNTLYVCGTDEYGTATETKAKAEGLTPQQICDKYHAIHADVYEWFDISFDYFGRTTTAEQTEVAQDIFLKCNDNNYIVEKETEQLFCSSCNHFLADRFVEGVCPLCGYVGARGDQCDGCGRPLNATQLKEPVCKFTKGCGTAPEVRATKHLYLDLKTLQPKIEEYFKQSSTDGVWSSNACDITLNWLREGLQERCITRDLDWGTKVPATDKWEGYDDKVFYVWFDAPIGYVSITANYTADWRKWWKNEDDNVDIELFQFMAKDNVLFHSIIFPGSQLGTGEKWTKVNNLSATEYLQYEDKKFSKSRGVGVFGNNAKDSGLSADIYRFYLLYIRPESADTRFEWSDLIAKHNADLLNNLGNFVNRAVKFCNNKHFKGKVPKYEETDVEKMRRDEINKEVEIYVKTIGDRVRLRDALRAVLSISQCGNHFIQETKPWEHVKAFEKSDDADVKAKAFARASTVVAFSLNIVHLIGHLLSPFMPATAQKILELLHADTQCVIPDTFELLLEEGHAIIQLLERQGADKSAFDKDEEAKKEETLILFKKIDEAKAEEWRKKYGGDVEEEKEEAEALPDDPLLVAQLVEEQATKVRTLKANGAGKAEIQKNVAELKRRKQKLKELTGEDVDANKHKQQKKKDTEKKEKKKGKSKKNKKKEYVGETGKLIKELGGKIAAQAKIVRDEKEKGNTDKHDEEMNTLNKLKEELKALKIKGDEEINQLEQQQKKE
eukprot:m.72946 g.72946  ORF g.72946 m.72946 type:complete len:781 (-) comp11763_c1_seq1:77-2419(-)